MSNSFKILATSDIHGTIYPTRYSDNKEQNFGLAKIKTLFNNYKDENTICIDNGDLIQGNPLTFYFDSYHKNKISPLTKTISKMGYDYLNLGNHDFNYGIKALSTHLENCNIPCITNNIYLKNKAFSQNYKVHTFPNGIKIALVGLTTQYISNWEKPENLIDITINNTFDTAKESIELIKKNINVDAIVLVYHGGFECDLETGEPIENLAGENLGYKICKELDFDIMITGHQHRSLASTCCGKIITQTMQNGQEVAYVEYNVNTKEGISKILIPDFEADNDILSINNDIELEVQNWLDKPLGKTNLSLKIENEFDARLNKHQLISFINQVQLDKSKADFSAVALFNDAKGFNSEITMRDIVSTYVFSNTLCVLKVTGKILKEFLEKCAEYFSVENDKIVVSKSFIYPKANHFNYDMVDGLDYTINVKNPIGSRITSMKRNNIPIELNKSYTLVVSNYRASGGGDFFMLKDCEIIEEIQEDMVEILAQYIINDPEFTVHHKDNIKVII